MTLKLPGEARVDPEWFRATVMRVGYDELRELVALWMNKKSGVLLGLEPGSDLARSYLAGMQGVSDFLRWVSETYKECRYEE